LLQCEALTDEDCRAEATALMRDLIDKIVFAPAEHEGRKTLSIDLYGDIAGILSMAAQTKKPPQKSGFSEESIKLVAGARNQRYLAAPRCVLTLTRKDE